MKTLKMSFRKSKIAFFLSTLAIFSALCISKAVASDPVNRILVSDECIGCGVCEEKAPHCFAVLDGKAEPLLGGILYLDELRDAYASCPPQAIYVAYY